jgi:hypothetical protein
MVNHAWIMNWYIDELLINNNLNRLFFRVIYLFILLGFYYMNYIHLYWRGLVYI